MAARDIAEKPQVLSGSAQRAETGRPDFSEKPMVLSGSEMGVEIQASHISEKPQVLSGSAAKAETGEVQFLEKPMVLSGPKHWARRPIASLVGALMRGGPARAGRLEVSCA